MSLVSKLTNQEKPKTDSPTQQNDDESQNSSISSYELPHAERKEKHPKKLGIVPSDSLTTVTTSPVLAGPKDRAEKKRSMSEKWKWQMSLRISKKNEGKNMHDMDFFNILRR